MHTHVYVCAEHSCICAFSTHIHMNIQHTHIHVYVLIHTHMLIVYIQQCTNKPIQHIRLFPIIIVSPKHTHTHLHTHTRARAHTCACTHIHKYTYTFSNAHVNSLYSIRLPPIIRLSHTDTDTDTDTHIHMCARTHARLCGIRLREKGKIRM